MIGTAAVRNLRRPDAHAAVEEDRDQRERRHPLDVLERQQAREPVGDVGRDRGDGQEQRGGREADPGGDDTDDDRERQRAGDDEDDASEVDDVVHVGILSVPGRDWRAGTVAAAPLTDSLPASHCRPHSGDRYSSVGMRLAALILLALALSAGVGDGCRNRRPAARSRSRSGRGDVQITGKGVLVGTAGEGLARRSSTSRRPTSGART